MYYLRSRYYNPDWGRFINAENTIYVDEMILNHNVFAYCLNNPVMRTDLDGTWGDWFAAITAVATAVVVAAAVIVAAPVVAAAAATTAVCLGVASAAGTFATVATVGCVTVAATTVACGVNRGVESVTGNNYGAALLGEAGYSVVETVTVLSAATISMAPSYLPYPSTGRTIPTNLKEQMKYEHVIRDGIQGNVIIAHLKDPRMPGWLGWQKYSIRGDGVDIHYVGNRLLPIRFDYKIK
ncbi:MAG: RHS repeat-associated core domain-containing protein [Acinetobacter sp.]